MSSWRRLLAAAAVAALTLGAGAALVPAVATAAPLYPVSDGDPFYTAPPGLAAHKPGDVLRVRQLPDNWQFPTSHVWQVLFRSTGAEGQPIAADTTYVLPNNHQPNGPLLSYQPIINALGTKCRVENELYTSDPLLQIRQAPALNVALLRGWAVSLPDHLGPDMEYGAARLGGQITLDGIRAVQRLPQFLVQRSPVALAGYSGGGLATAWAAAMARSYAPELHIVGSAEGGVPMNLAKMAHALADHPHPAFGLAFAAALGLERAYPNQLDVTDQLNAQGRRLQHEIANGCTNEIMAFGAGHSAGQMTDNTNFMDDPAAWKLLNENSLELYQGIPDMPIFEWHSPTDVLIPVDSIENTLHRYCQAGVKVESMQVPSPDHLSAAVIGSPAAFDWLADRFADAPAPSNC
ncbi:lipase [Rhodococcus sp. D2-41]|uniref:Lipase family protein n=1 Tax=Speluncibacter jeojiensis TaxID=2710754 RepID=A0A9X4M1Y1_9ACTN|nr:lipase family protein [Rhodococcus sp. D2-41]MDG3008908.1 lipase [Rhodococcus sp. D2-41]MDG3016530.1 lipase family protein [Corynebacteriales bacterium D3-21]